MTTTLGDLVEAAVQVAVKRAVQAADKQAKQAILAAHPVGSYYITEGSENPADVLGGGDGRRPLKGDACGDRMMLMRQGRRLKQACRTLPAALRHMGRMAITFRKSGRLSTPLLGRFPALLRRTIIDPVVRIQAALRRSARLSSTPLDRAPFMGSLQQFNPLHWLSTFGRGQHEYV